VFALAVEVEQMMFPLVLTVALIGELYDSLFDNASAVPEEATRRMLRV
jgi:hypothetical protein